MSRHLRYAAASPVALSKNEAHQFAADHALSIYPSQSVCTFIPKNGCSALRYAVAVANGVLRPGADIAWIHKNNDTFKSSLPHLALAEYTFTIVRCPFRRLASAFLDKVVGEIGRRERFIRASGVPESEITFRRFALAMVDEQVRNADHHWTPQSRFFVYSEYDDVFCLENFDGMAQRLKARINFDIVDVRDKVRHSLDQFTLTEGTFADMPMAEIAATRLAGKSPSARSLYDAEIYQMVANVYAEDAEFHLARAPTGAQLTLDA
ncbi:MAG: hypothetical protein EON59_04950 [Alphaproteobacteria bacterium]|nr:MAG: hypothetical protein EON59_04950 [Alphaproteobacteria bacterium]